jgi:low affinity Fe/Cu permease
MKNIYHRAETIFEKVTGVATKILGSSITFTFAAGMVLFWWSSESFYTQDMQHIIRDIIHGLTFLSLFILQKESNRFTGSLHLKINELIVSHKTANNAVINAELKTEHEIIELVKEYNELAVKAEELAVRTEEKMNHI